MCKFIRFIYLLIPIHGFRSFLIQKHFDGCSLCQKEWGMDQSVLDHPSKPEWVEQEDSLWPGIQERILAGETGETRSMKRKTRFFFPKWQWALVGSGLIILIGIYFGFINSRMKESKQEDASLAFRYSPVHIIHAEIHGKKATPFIYHSQENLFIWFDEINQEED